ncbi:hypothetical protein [Legionella tucsonensis]|uniref:hypothetical protein n=1 Tax=Legionella tucsonensis TaxID=40335 RepID=UPI001EE7536B|nr:hypothetical protein [Legionella tucsonensis]
MQCRKEKNKSSPAGWDAHGAFTWGLLDKLLESKLFTIEGISATSTRSMNAAEIDGEFYWDGGYLGSLAIFPLIYQTSCRDILTKICVTSRFQPSILLIGSF